MKPTVFLLTDTQIKEESFLEDIDSLLNTGEVPNLFAVDEKAELVEVWIEICIHQQWILQIDVIYATRARYVVLQRQRFQLFFFHII